MSDEYIKRDSAQDAVINIVGWEKIAKYVDEMSKHPSTKDIDYYDALMDAEDVIADIPSADVAPVRHEHWIDDAGALRCSFCGVSFPDLHPLYEKARYCPCCGSKMDGGDEDE